jgi:hypothetical protein
MVSLNISHSQRVFGFDFGIGGFGITRWTIMIYWIAGAALNYIIAFWSFVFFFFLLGRIFALFYLIADLVCFTVILYWWVFAFANFALFLCGLIFRDNYLRGWFDQGINCNKAFPLSFILKSYIGVQSTL